MKNLLPCLPLLLLATDANARVIHINTGMDQETAVFLSIAVTIALAVVGTLFIRRR